MSRTKRLLVICPYPEGVAAGQRLKYEQYFDDWRAAGWDITVANYMDMALWNVIWDKGHAFTKALGVFKGHLRRLRDLFRIARYDLVYLHMWATPFGTTLFERLIRWRAKALVYDIEDNVVIGNATASDQGMLRRLLKGPGKARYLIRTADHVITSSPFLNDVCLGLNRKKACTYISSSVDTDRFQPATPYSNDRQVVIGWTGTFSSRPYLDLLRGVFQRLARKHDFRLRVIGNFDYQLPGVELEVIRWNAAQEVEQLQALDIGVYPLPVDDWVMGKSGLKAIQYMAFALPCVATNVGNTPNIIRNGENGMLVTSEDDWEAALARLLDGPDLRRKLGEAARIDAEAKYSVRAVAAQYRAALENAVR
jgi:glycosyltransferase involved in cell wall biosynthesis